MFVVEYRFAVLANEEGCEESASSETTEPVGDCVTRQWANCHPASCSTPATWSASGEAFRRIEHFARADTQVDSAEDDSPGASDVNGVEFPKEFDLTRG